MTGLFMAVVTDLKGDALGLFSALFLGLSDWLAVI
jgi:hypothetical protein